jgi:DNA polymerase/3'-5' exonuclease PolX
MNLAAATRLAERIRDEIAPHCDRIEIAGSIRRRRPECGDIDLVCLPKVGGKAEITERCGRTAKLVKHGTQYVVFELANGFQLDLWFAHAGAGDLFAREPSNWGALLLSRTGSAAHNIHLCNVAHSKGLHFNPHRGLERRGAVVASETEEAIFVALSLDFIAPEAREA